MNTQPGAHSVCQPSVSWTLPWGMKAAALSSDGEARIRQGGLPQAPRLRAAPCLVFKMWFDSTAEAWPGHLVWAPHGRAGKGHMSAVFGVLHHGRAGTPGPGGWDGGPCKQLALPWVLSRAAWALWQVEGRQGSLPAGAPK